jgi:hypothetical protein
LFPEYQPLQELVNNFPRDNISHWRSQGKNEVGKMCQKNMEDQLHTERKKWKPDKEK